MADDRLTVKSRGHYAEVDVLFASRRVKSDGNDCVTNNIIKKYLWKCIRGVNRMPYLSSLYKNFNINLNFFSLSPHLLELCIYYIMIISTHISQLVSFVNFHLRPDIIFTTHLLKILCLLCYSLVAGSCLLLFLQYFSTSLCLY